MKKLILCGFLFAAMFSAFSQDTIKPKICHNEFGIDATGFIRQFLTFSTGGDIVEYAPIYYFTYRRHFKCGNIRFAIGGDLNNHKPSTGMWNDPNKYDFKYYSVDARIGWEFFNKLSKRWYVYYGLDFKPSFLYRKDDLNGYNSSYATGYFQRIQSYGLSPLLGFKFKLSNRLSLATEASFTVYMQQEEYKNYYKAINNTYPLPVDKTYPINKILGTSFTQPVSLFLAFDF